ncbi:DUF4123 domain-containing protein [Pseudomonas syringae pv. tagetis]|uniref:DUF4123 domain-containing protein n=2 Tax=Pseudomonas syringae group genomosp. 7 TaxID=251699 RepID=A0A0Q0B1J7_9PSED|nr:DUF4123 domain-containing protein [Pseudomonas syringae group genomosp. 7]KPX45514.1 putative Membrane protein [Pseudomonas syringae pv. helianthi]KPY82154.1 putative Membrane protein [Pseudomonas syringae pv. tagetis]RMW18461.1 putative Membrane protein [Pseudomonas syringae pv. tagetis]RMW21013.1 putative Membrane protein [Pseudomonas syringae pv. tagetis]UNB64358.1 DUF4123 domain-containing protein [Pseudomonas syringae pv. helianthi]
MFEFESGPGGLPWSKNAYLLLNAINLPQLRRKLFEWNPAPICTLLFLQTRFSELLDHSPALVQIDGPYDPTFSDFLTNACEEWGLLLFSDADHKTVADHLRWLVFVDKPTGKACHLNLSDPPVANALFGLHPAHIDNRLFGPIDSVYAADVITEHWVRHERRGEPAIHENTTLYRMSERQMEAMNDVAFRLIVISLDQHLRTFFPDYLTSTGLKSRYGHVYALAVTAYEAGFNSEADIFHYANVTCFLATQPAESQLDIRMLMNEKSSLTPSRRIQQANWLAVKRSREQHEAIRP